MGIGFYETSYKRIPHDFDVGDKEFDFLERFMTEAHEAEYYLDKERLEEIVKEYKADGKEIPEGLIKFLREQMREDGDFDFVISW